MSESIIIQWPASPAGKDDRELVLLFHGVGSSAQALKLLGAHVAQAMPQAVVVSVASPHPSALGSGHEWFSVLGITEANRPERIAAALPAFAQTVAHWQREAGSTPARTTLIGFSQGAIMALASSLLMPMLARTVVSIAGRFAAVPTQASAAQRLHFIHGEQDQVIPASHSVTAASALAALGTRTTLDVLHRLGHGIDERVALLLVRHLASDQAQGHPLPA